MTDSDAYDESTASIRFDGSVFALEEHGEALVLEPFVSKGAWGWGFGARFPRLPPVHERDRAWMRKEFTAAVKSTERSLR